MTDLARRPFDPSTHKDYYWICWEEGEPINVLPRDMAERWLRRGNYMYKSISPLSMQSEPSQIDLAVRFGLMDQSAK